MKLNGRLFPPVEKQVLFCSIFCSQSKKDAADKIYTPSSCTLSGAIIRRFDPLDQKEAFALNQKSMATIEQKFFFNNGMDDIQKFFFEDRPRQDFIIMKYNGKIVGMGGLKHENAKTVQLTRLRADPDLAGQHICESIVDVLVQRAKELGYSQLISYTFHGAVMHLLPKFGFVEVERCSSENYSWVPSGEQAYKYLKELD